MKQLLQMEQSNDLAVKAKGIKMRGTFFTEWQEHLATGVQIFVKLGVQNLDHLTLLKKRILLIRLRSQKRHRKMRKIVKITKRLFKPRRNGIHSLTQAYHLIWLERK